MQFLLVIASREPGHYRSQRINGLGWLDHKTPFCVRPSPMLRQSPESSLSTRAPCLGPWQPRCGSLEADNLESCPACQLKRPRLVLLGKGMEGR